jgi:hypothetical protein
MTVRFQLVIWLIKSGGVIDRNIDVIFDVDHCEATTNRPQTTKALLADDLDQAVFHPSRLIGIKVVLLVAYHKCSWR